MNTLLRRSSGLSALPASGPIGLHAMRITIALAFLWIGGQKFAPYEADSLTPFTANGPVMSMFYAHPVPVDSAQAVLAATPRPTSMLGRVPPLGAPVRS